MEENLEKLLGDATQSLEKKILRYVNAVESATETLFHIVYPGEKTYDYKPPTEEELREITVATVQNLLEVSRDFCQIYNNNIQEWTRLGISQSCLKRVGEELQQKTIKAIANVIHEITELNSEKSYEFAILFFDEQKQ